MNMQHRIILAKIGESIVHGDPDRASALVAKAVVERVSATHILLTIQKSLGVVGRKFEKGEYFLPEVLASAESAKKTLEIAAPHLQAMPASNRARIVVGTVYGDIHDIGKNILATVLSAAGHEVRDLGTNVSDLEFIRELRKGADFLLMSALTTTTMLYMRSVIEAVEDADLRKGLKIIVGGAPITERFAKEIGADGYGKNAFDALGKVNRLARGKT